MATVQLDRGGAVGKFVAHGVGSGGSEKAVWFTFNFTAAQASGTVYAAPAYIQAGSIITGMKLILNGQGSATFDVGDSTTGNRFFAAATTSGSSTARPYVVPTNLTLQITQGGSATSASGSIDLVVYHLPRNA